MEGSYRTPIGKEAKVEVVIVKLQLIFTKVSNNHLQDTSKNTTLEVTEAVVAEIHP
jgi:hypothetical protein